jgi:hypothetical protein
MDATGYDEVSWDDNGMYGTREGGDGKYENIDRPIERITRRTPPKKRKIA